MVLPPNVMVQFNSRRSDAMTPYKQDHRALDRAITHLDRVLAKNSKSCRKHLGNFNDHRDSAV